MLEQAALVDDIELSLVNGDIQISAVEPDTGLSLALLSEPALSDWDRAEEDAAWAHLQ